MAKIDAIIGFSWTTFVARGPLQLDDFLGIIHGYFPRLLFNDVIWDLSAASIATLSRTDFEAMICAVKKYEGVRGHAKTVFVGNSSETFALVCMYTGLAAMAEVNVDYYAFSTLEQAERWLICNRVHSCSSPGSGAKLHNCGERACQEVRHYQAARKAGSTASIAEY